MQMLFRKENCYSTDISAYQEQNNYYIHTHI